MAAFKQNSIRSEHHLGGDNHPNDLPKRCSVLGVVFLPAASNGTSGLHVSLADPTHGELPPHLVPSVSARRREALHQSEASSLRIRSFSNRRRPRRSPFLRPQARGWHTQWSSPSLGMAPVREASMTNRLALMVRDLCWRDAARWKVQASGCRRQGLKVNEPERSGLSPQW